MPVVPDKSTAKARLNGESPALQRAWYQGQVAKFFSFDEAPLSGSNVPLSPIYVTFNINPDQPNGVFRFQSRTQLRADSQRAGHTARGRRILSIVAGGRLRQRQLAGGQGSENRA